MLVILVLVSGCTGTVVCKEIKGHDEPSMDSERGLMLCDLKVEAQTHIERLVGQQWHWRANHVTAASCSSPVGMCTWQELVGFLCAATPGIIFGELCKLARRYLPRRLSSILRLRWPLRNPQNQYVAIILLPASGLSDLQASVVCSIRFNDTGSLIHDR
jgi:hypothetical protein